MERKTTSERLKEIMELKDLRQVDVINKVTPFCNKYGEKITKSHLSQWVAGKNEPNQKKLTLLAMALDVSEPFLMGYDVPMLRKNLSVQEMAEQDAEMTNDPLWSNLYELFKSLSDSDKQEVANFIKFKANK